MRAERSTAACSAASLLQLAQNALKEIHSADGVLLSRQHNSRIWGDTHILVMRDGAPPRIMQQISNLIVPPHAVADERTRRPCMTGVFLGEHFNPLAWIAGTWPAKEGPASSFRRPANGKGSEDDRFVQPR
jgi:hypothetical protein